MHAQQQSLDPLCTEHLQADLKGRSVRGGLFTISSQGTQFFIQSVQTVVLARLLTPADFGLVAMVTAVTGLAQGFADVGLSEATIQRQEINHDQVSTLFWINVAVGLGLMLATMALGPVLAWFYGEPRLTYVALLMSLTFLIGGSRVQPDAILKRQMQFRSLAVRDIAASVLGVVAAVTTALLGGGYWALVAFPLTANLTQMTLSWIMVNWKPSLPRRGTKVGSLVAFGGNVAASYFIYNVNRSADSVLVGWYWGAGPLGLYSKALSLLMLPLRQLAAPVGSVVIPTFSRTQGDPERFARYYLRTVNLTTWALAPIFGFLFVAAQPVITLILGTQWQKAAPVFQILATCALAQLILDSILWLLVSRGQSGRLVKLLLSISPVLIGSFAIGLPFGIKGVALVGSLTLVGVLPWVLKFAFRGTLLTLQQLGKAIVCPISLVLAAVFLAEVALHVAAPQRIVTQLTVVALGFATAYSLSLLIPAVRKQVMSFMELFGESRLSRQSTWAGQEVLVYEANEVIP
jgi:PST family polysaccharide transporter